MVHLSIDPLPTLWGQHIFLWRYVQVTRYSQGFNNEEFVEMRVRVGVLGNARPLCTVCEN